MKVPLFLILLSLSLTGCLYIFSEGAMLNHREKAEAYAKEGKYDKAIAEYEEHIKERCLVKDRPAWENPAFYKLIIGDLYLKIGKLQQAMQSYESAEKLGVEKSEVYDRFRQAGTWLEGKGKLKEAIELLKKYRNRDPLLMDSLLDRLARELVAAEPLQ